MEKMASCALWWHAFLEDMSRHVALHKHTQWLPKKHSWPTTHPNPNCTLCPNDATNTWSHLLSICSNQHIKGLWVGHHNNAAHQTVHTLQSNKHTCYYILINTGIQKSRPQDVAIPIGYLNVPAYLHSNTHSFNHIPFSCVYVIMRPSLYISPWYFYIWVPNTTVEATTTSSNLNNICLKF